MGLRTLLNKQLGRIKRGISLNADMSEHHRVDENFTNLFWITPHLCSLQLYNVKLKRHSLILTTFPSVVQLFVSTHYTQSITYFLVHIFLATVLIKYSV